MLLAEQLNAAGIKCFPCAVHFDTIKNKWQKKPLTVNREHWIETAKRPLSDPAVQWQGAKVIGVPIPPNVVVLDGDWYKEGASKEAAEAVFGCVIPWDEARIQTTIGGGEHYAFRLPEWEVRQGSDFSGSHIDTRVTGKGFICSGDGYTPFGFGCLRMAYPESLPVLPDGCRDILEQPEVSTAPAPTPIETKDAEVETIMQALGFISPDIPHDEWIRYGMALRHQFQSDPDLGFSLFDRWSYGEFTPDKECPASYLPEEVSLQYWKLKPLRSDGSTSITIATIYHKAVHGGWIPPATIDTSLAFGDDAAPANEYSRVLSLIHESGTDSREIQGIAEAITSGGFNPLQTGLLRGELKAALRGAKLLDKGLTAVIDQQIGVKGSPFTTPAIVPDVLDVGDLVGRPLSRPSGNHGVNARLMISEVFAGRVASLHGVLRWWSGREWQIIPGDKLIRITLEALMPDQSKTPNAKNTITALLALVDPLGESIRGPVILFKDCVVNVLTGEVSAHSASNCNIGCLTVNYTTQGAAPNWFTFLEQIFGDSEDYADRVALLQEVIGWAMLQSDLNVQKAVVLEGASRGGKGLILEVLLAILGDKGGTTTFDSLGEGKTQSDFRGHDVMVDMEATSPPYQALRAVIGFLNKIISNEPVSIPLLNTQQPWTGRLNSKLIMACNSIPSLIDDSGATTNRLIVLYFTRSFAARQDHGLLSRLLPEVEAIAGWAVDGARRLVQNGGQFTQPKTSIEAHQDMKETNQPLTAFIEQYLEVDQEARCISGDIWAAYRIYASECNIKLGTRNAFSRSLRSALLAYPCKYHRVLRVGARVSSGYEGVQVRDMVVGAPPVTASAFKPEIVK